jgi:hypothetical protein
MDQHGSHAVGVFTDLPKIELGHGHSQSWSSDYGYDYQQPYEGEHAHHNPVLGMKNPYHHVPSHSMKLMEPDIYAGDSSPYMRSPFEGYPPTYSGFQLSTGPPTSSACSPATLSYDDNDTDSTTSKSQMWSVPAAEDYPSSDSRSLHHAHHDDMEPQWSMAPCHTIGHGSPSPITPAADTFVALNQVYPEGELSGPMLVEHCEGGVSTPGFQSGGIENPYIWSETEVYEAQASIHSEDDARASSPESVEEVVSDQDDPSYNPSHPSKATHKRRPSSGSKRQARTKRQGTHRRASSGSGNQRTSSGRAFPCPLANYGCAATFASKNEWKRHVATQHVKLGFWRCDLCPATSSGHNDFNRKDLFTQHLKRMHRQHIVDRYDPEKLASYADVSHIPDNELKEATEPLVSSCFRELRQAPTRCRCLFCEKVFKGSGAWENRMEHIAMHLERTKKSGCKLPLVHEWKEDEELENWLEQEGLIELNKGTWQIGNGRPIRNDRKLKTR